MNYLEITVWLEEHQYQALADHLVDDSNLDKVVTEILQNLYEKCVPAEERERIKEIVAQEEAMRKAEEAASRRFVFIEAKKNGVTSCRIGEGYGTPLEVAHACALHYSQAKKMSGQEFLEAAYKETETITKEEFEERCAVDGERIKGIYSLDFAHNTITAELDGNTSTLPMNCMVKAAKAAYRRVNLKLEERMEFFAKKLEELVPAQNEKSSEIEPGYDMTQGM